MKALRCFDPNTRITSIQTFNVIAQEIILKVRDNIELIISIEKGDGDISEITEFVRRGELDIPKKIKYKMRLEVEFNNYKVKREEEE